MNYFRLVFKQVVLKLLRIYQKTLSLDYGPLRKLFPYGYCRFHPSCSEYTYQAVVKYGAITGLWKGLKRLVRCHPWSQGGEDPLL